VKICILGFGKVGSRLAHLWSEAGHAVSIGLRPDSKRIDAAHKVGMRVLEPSLAAQHSDVIGLALPWQAVEDTLNHIDQFDGKVLIDATNPLNTDLSVLTPKEGSGGQQIAAWYPKTRVVKAFNTIGAEYVGNAIFDMYYCSDDKEAAGIGHDLIKDARMRPVNVGPLKNAGYLEQIAGLWINLAVGGQIQGAFGFNLVREHGR
jgi:predicted dinucleotide-binding enzyme